MINSIKKEKEILEGIKNCISEARNMIVSADLELTSGEHEIMADMEQMLYNFANTIDAIEDRKQIVLEEIMEDLEEYYD